MPTKKLKEAIIEAAILGFESQKRNIDIQIAQLRQMRDGATEPPTGSERPQRRLSAAGRRAIAEAARRRWAEIRGESPQAASNRTAPKRKRKLSPAGRKAIQEALRRRWAAKRAEAAKAKRAAAKKAGPARKQRIGQKVAAKTAAAKAAAKKAPAKRTATKSTTSSAIPVTTGAATQ